MTASTPKPAPSGKPVDAVAFAKLRRIAPAALAARRAEVGPVPVPELPEEISLKLTNRCDLRCSHCYQWGEDGYHHSLDAAERNGDLPLDIIENLLDATRSNQANLYLWGGEPFVYREWNRLAELLAEHHRWTSICTNGTLLERRLPSMLPLADRLELVVSIDGFESEHDRLRGAGSLARTLSGVRAAVAAKRDGRFSGEISVNCVVGDHLIGRVFDLVAWLEAEGVDSVYVSLPWFVAPGTAQAMDRYLADHAPWTSLTDGATAPSWHSYTFSLDVGRIDALRRDLERVRQHRWGVKVRFNPVLADDELEPFLVGSGEPAQGQTRCVSLSSRLDVFPDGRVVSCKFFPESVVGDLRRDDLATVWHGRRFQRVRDTVSRCGLMPGCAKCPLLYSRGH